jgi:transcriptional regulator with XRE-family HTH domain
MRKLQTWMDKQGVRDAQVAITLNLSRVQVSRIRRGITKASVPTAHALEALTKIKWWYFVDGEATPPKPPRPRRRASRRKAAP